MALNEREFQQYVQLSRMVALQYDLDSYTDSQIQDIRRMLQRSTREITQELTNRIATERLTEWQADRAGALLNQAERMTAGIQTRLSNDIASTATEAGLRALQEHNSIISWSGMIGGFNNVALSSSQLKSFMFDSPLHGHTLRNWVDRAFDREIKQKIREEIATGVFRGKGYPDLVRRVQTAFDNLTNREAITLVRTYVQAANVNALKNVYEQNSDVIEKVKWSAVLENGFRSSGRGTCLICAGLDGNIYPKDDHPLCPIHPRCRCTLIPVTKTFRELGLDINEVEKAHRPYTIRTNKNIDAGGRRKIREVGRYQGNYSTWFEEQSARTQLNIVGPNRLRMIDRGEISFKDLVDPRTGRVYTLQELDAGVMVKAPPGAAGSDVLTDAWGFKMGTKSNLLAEELLYNPLTSKEIKALEWNTYNHTFPPIRKKLADNGVLFKDGQGRFYTIRPDDIDDHATLGLKGLIEKRGKGGGPKPLPPDPEPVKPDVDKLKKQVRKAAGFKAGSKSEKLLEGLMDNPMNGKEIKAFMDSSHDFPAVRKKLVDLDLIAKNENGKWYVKALVEDGPSPKPPAPKPKKKAAPKPKPKPKPAKKDTPEYWEQKIKDSEAKLRSIALHERARAAFSGKFGGSPTALDKYADDLKTYNFANKINTKPRWQLADLSADEKKLLRKMIKEHDKILDAQVQLYRLAPPKVREEMRKEMIDSMLVTAKGISRTVAYKDALRGTSHYPFRVMKDMQRHGFKMTYKSSGRAYFSPREGAVMYLSGLQRGEVAAHEVSHAIDSFMAGKARDFSWNFGKWKKGNAYTQPTEQVQYRDWYDKVKTGGKGTYSNGDGKYWKGNWVNDYEGRIYGGANRFAEQYWSMNNQRFYQSVRYYKENVKNVKPLTGTQAKKVESDLRDWKAWFLEREEAYHKGDINRFEFQRAQNKYDYQVKKVKGGAAFQDVYTSKEELWEAAVKREGWGKSRQRYPEFSEWFENDFMKRQGISWETDFDG